ncbi:MAG TPA: Coenzyme F420 hydrogenase/dehydrogenase, beta subunit C-terminal domain [Candidatus Lokiarchaeia archaeon]|nr:Coenzyme F420 hydrogenase/dehydrogenase, beta subunit C-terminal domain [Candidatus Lokiarchaeia archaeon]
MSIKNFQDLINDVHDKGICQECGGCVSFCSSATYNVIGFTEPYSPPVYINKDQCLECGICYYICPQTHVLDEELNKTFNFEGYDSMPMGFVRDIYSCQSTDDEFLEHGTDGGVVNSIINYMLEKKICDGAIVSSAERPFSRTALFSKTKDDLLKASGIRLDQSPQLDEVQKFSTYTHTIREMNHFKFNKLAIVGTSCQIDTIRCMQHLGITPSENIEICLGLFCYENFIFDSSQIRKFEREFRLKFQDIQKLNIKEDLYITLKDDGTEHETVHVPFDRLKEYMRPACHACSDFSNIYSDISFGGLGSEEKFTTVITRTEKGQKLVTDAIKAGIIRAADLDDEAKSKLKDVITDFSRSKLRRMESFMNSRP